MRIQLVLFQPSKESEAHCLYDYAWPPKLQVIVKK